jgi:hypothetical protein
MTIPLPRPRLRELRSLVATPECRRPRVYACRGCGMAFRASEGHDFARCVARLADEKKGARCFAS